MKRAVTVKGSQAVRSYAATPTPVTPTPVPGGANQRAGVARTFGKNAGYCK